MMVIVINLFLISSCSIDSEVEKTNSKDIGKGEQNNVKTNESASSMNKNNYESIYNIIDSVDKIGHRVLGTDNNQLLIDELEVYTKEKYLDAKINVQPYIINIPVKYNVTISTGNDSVTFNDENSICKYINKSKLSEKNVILTDSLNAIKPKLNYIFISEDESMIEESKKYENICLSIQTVENIFLGQNTIKSKTDRPSIMGIDNNTAVSLKEMLNKKVMLSISTENKEIELKNLFVTIKGKNSNNCIVVTSHIDTTTATGNNYSNGAIDNGSGISLNLNMLKRVYDNKLESNYDIVFAFVNSEEGFLLQSLSGSMQLYNLLSYENILDINLDCLGEKNIDMLSYGLYGNINKTLINEIVSKNIGETFKLEKVDSYISDNINFDNSIYFYNFNYHGNNRVIHTENDTKNMVDTKKLEKISNVIYGVLTQIVETKPMDLFM